MEGNEGGLKLLGVKKQRVAIARTLLKSPLVILLDEATSAWDSTTGKHIQSALNEICANWTTLVVAHRLLKITNVDVILVLQEGEIAQRGNHSELIEVDGPYKELWDQQSKIETQDKDNATKDASETGDQA